jgi:hypothetical protein
LYEDSGGTAAGLAACPELVRALFRSSVELQDTTALMILRKICSWETARDKFSLGGFSGDEQVQLLQLARDECSSAINRATVFVAQQGGEEHKRAQVKQLHAARLRTGLVCSTMALVNSAKQIVFSAHELEASVALVSIAVAARSEFGRLDLQRVPWVKTHTGGGPNEFAGGSRGMRGANLEGLEVQEGLVGLLYMARSVENHQGLLTGGVRSIFSTILEMWEFFSESHLYPMAVFLQSEEVMSASDVELCVGLLFTLGTRKELLEELAQLSPKALTGLAQLVKQSTIATSRRFGAKTLYLLSLSSKLSWSKQSALVNVAEAMAYRDMAFNGP